MSFSSTILLTKHSCTLVYTPFGDVDQFSVKAVERYEQALQEAEKSGIKIRALLLTNPHNPLGCSSKIYAIQYAMLT
jgi:bifunctional pyridoxal-dependent enzyme with beta-cystathionase and maltose regulon repressor activities